jgi:pimeloyl-ACP methyl ester carboxylesterase
MKPVQRGLARPAGEPSIAWAQAGDGVDIVLIHGALVTLEDMVLGLFPSLSKDARVTAFDRPGHGGSEATALSGSPWRQAAAIHAAAGALGLDRPVVIGHSFGAAVAMAYALQFPKATRGVVALAPIAFPEPRLEHLVFAPRGLPAAGALWNAFGRAFVDPALLPLLWNAMFLPQAMPGDYAAHFPFQVAGDAAAMRSEGDDALCLNGGLARSLVGYHTCQVPVEVFAGDRDQVVNPIHARTLAALLPKGRLTSMPGLGHMLHHFDPDTVAATALGLAVEAAPSAATSAGL